MLYGSCYDFYSGYMLTLRFSRNRSYTHPESRVKSELHGPISIFLVSLYIIFLILLFMFVSTSARTFIVYLFEFLFSIFLTCSAVLVYEFYKDGKLRRVYSLIIIFVALFLMIDSINLAKVTMGFQKELFNPFFIPAYLIVAVVILLALKRMYDIWITPFTDKKHIFILITIICIIIDLIVTAFLYATSMLARLTLAGVAFLIFTEYNVIVMGLTLYLVSFFRKSTYSVSWTLIFSFILLFSIRNVINCVIILLGLPTFLTDISESLAIGAYLLGSLGFLAQRFKEVPT